MNLQHMVPQQVSIKSHSCDPHLGPHESHFAATCGSAARRHRKRAIVIAIGGRPPSCGWTETCDVTRSQLQVQLQSSAPIHVLGYRNMDPTSVGAGSDGPPSLARLLWYMCEGLNAYIRHHDLTLLSLNSAENPLSCIGKGSRAEAS